MVLPARHYAQTVLKAKEPEVTTITVTPGHEPPTTNLGMGGGPRGTRLLRPLLDSLQVAPDAHGWTRNYTTSTLFYENDADGNKRPPEVTWRYDRGRYYVSDHPGSNYLKMSPNHLFADHGRDTYESGKSLWQSVKDHGLDGPEGRT